MYNENYNTLKYEMQQKINPSSKNSKYSIVPKIYHFYAKKKVIKNKLSFLILLYFFGYLDSYFKTFF